MLQSSPGIDHIHFTPTFRVTMPLIFFFASLTVRCEICFLFAAAKISPQGSSVAAVQHGSDQFLCLHHFRFFLIAVAGQQFLGRNIFVTVEPIKAFLVTEIEGEGLTFGSKRGFVVNDDTDIFVAPQSAHHENTSCRGAEVNGAEPSVGTAHTGGFVEVSYKDNGTACPLCDLPDSFFNSLVQHMQRFFFLANIDDAFLVSPCFYEARLDGIVETVLCRLIDHR